jgi:hypothetical protein
LDVEYLLQVLGFLIKFLAIKKSVNLVFFSELEFALQPLPAPMNKIAFLLIFFRVWIPALGQDTSDVFKPYHVLAMGAGESWGSAVLSTKLVGFLSTGGVSIRSHTPVYCGAFEKRINKYFGLGAAISYQKFEVATNFGFFGGPVVPDGKDIYTRKNYAIRGLLHMVQSSSLEVYWGARIGYTDWELTSDSFDPAIIKQKTIKDDFSGQVFFGIRYFFRKIGLGYEVGIGSAPYLVMANIAFKFTDD